MFRVALLKLTLLYLAIIMAISIFFSLVIFNVSSLEIANNAGRQQNAIDRLGRGGLMMNDPILLAERQKIVDEANQNIINNLFYTNLAILIFGGGLSYFLAGMSLKPIEEVHESQSRFTGDASHELRSPLAAMKSEIEVALRDPKLTKEEAITLLGSNLEEVDRLKILSDGLLELARDNGKSIEKTDFDLSKVVAQSITKTSGQAKLKYITIVTDLDERIQLHGNRSQVEELLVIVIDNAIKYSDEKKSILIESSARGKNAVIRIKDEGTGIGQEDLPRIFDRFYRADKSRVKNAAHGYGLGLALAKKIVLANGGSIVAESRLGAGSTFSIKLPLSHL